MPGQTFIDGEPKKNAALRFRFSMLIADFTDIEVVEITSLMVFVSGRG